MADILVVKVNAVLHTKEFMDIQNYIRHQKETGVIVLPLFCDAQIVPDDVQIRIENCFEEWTKENEKD